MIVRYTNPSRIRDQLLHCLDVLGEEYNELDYVVDVYKNEDRLRKEMVECPDMSPEEYQQILHGATRPPAIAMMESRTIKIFYFNLSKEKHKQDLDLAFFSFMKCVMHGRIITDYILMKKGWQTLMKIWKSTRIVPPRKTPMNLQW